MDNNPDHFTPLTLRERGNELLIAVSLLCKKSVISVSITKSVNGFLEHN